MNGDLPEGWARASIGDVITDLTYGTAKKCNYEQHGVPVLRIPNVSNGKIDHADLKYAELPATERKNLSVTSGDVLVILMSDWLWLLQSLFQISALRAYNLREACHTHTIFA